MRGGISFGADNTFAVQGDLSLPLFAPSVYRTLKMNDAQMATAGGGAFVAHRPGWPRWQGVYNILLAEQSLAVLRESEATVQRTVDDTQVQYEHGTGLGVRFADGPGAVEQPEAHDPADREFDPKLAKLMLKMYLSIPEEVEIEVVGELDALRDEVLAGTDGLTTDVTDNSDLRSLELQEEVLQRSLRRPMRDACRRSQPSVRPPGRITTWSPS